MHHCCRRCPADNIPKCVSVLKPTGHLSHIQNLGSDKDAIQAMAQKHADGTSQQNASHTIVAPNGAQLEEVLNLMAAGKVKLEVAQVRMARCSAVQYISSAGGEDLQLLHVVALIHTPVGHLGCGSAPGLAVQ